MGVLNSSKIWGEGSQSKGSPVLSLLEMVSQSLVHCIDNMHLGSISWATTCHESFCYTQVTTMVFLYSAHNKETVKSEETLPLKYMKDE